MTTADHVQVFGRISGADLKICFRNIDYSRDGGMAQFGSLTDYSLVQWCLKHVGPMLLGGSLFILVRTHIITVRQLSILFIQHKSCRSNSHILYHLPPHFTGSQPKAHPSQPSASTTRGNSSHRRRHVHPTHS